MNRYYIALTILAVGLAVGILLMDRNKQIKEIEPLNLAIAYNDPSRFLSVDEVTDRIIKEDPGLVLIDVRPADQYKKFAIPGSINIPYDSLFTTSSLDLLKRKELDKVFCSNSAVWSDQAWLLCTRLEMPAVFVLEGGVNNWFNSIVQATEPSATAPREAFDRYSFRLAANQFFYGVEKKAEAPITKPTVTVAKPAPVKRSEPAAETGGGC